MLNFDGSERKSFIEVTRETDMLFFSDIPLFLLPQISPFPPF